MLRAARAATSTATDGNNLDATIVSLALALGHHTLELGEGQVNHATVAGAHRLERDDLPVAHGLLAEAARHAGQRIFTAAAVAVGVHADVTALDARPVHGAVHDELQRGEHLALLA